MTGYVQNFYDKDWDLHIRFVARLCAFLAATGAVINIIYGYVSQLVRASRELSDISEAADFAAQAVAEQRLVKTRAKDSRQNK